MKKLLISTMLVAVFATSPLFAESKQTDLQKEAKVTKQQATETALTKVPGGTIKSSELEREHGKLVWSFDIASKKSKDITEVQVDAITGDVVSVEKESPAKQAQEAAADHKKASKRSSTAPSK